MPGNDILFRYQSSGASASTAAQSEKLKKKNIIGVQASNTLAEEDLGRLRAYTPLFVSLGEKHGLPPALLAAIASRESRAGALLDEGWGDHHNGFGLMQVDRRSHTLKGGPYSLEHLDQATGILKSALRAVVKKHPDWSSEQQLRGGVAAYNFGDKNVQSLKGMDTGTTGNDYSSDVWARARFLAQHIGGGPGHVPATAPVQGPKPQGPKPQGPKPQEPAAPGPKAAEGHPLEVVHELQKWLVRHGYMTEAEVKTGPGIPGPKTHAAAARFLAEHTPAEAAPFPPAHSPPPPAPKPPPVVKKPPVTPVPPLSPVPPATGSPGDVRTTVHVKTPFHVQPTQKACFDTACLMAREAGVKVLGSDQLIQVAMGEDRHGRVKVDPQQVRKGLAYIDQQLEANRPVVVGVSHMDASYNVDLLTDHFVIITGRGMDPQGRLFYSFHDPATANGNDSNTQHCNRFSVDAQTGNLYRKAAGDTKWVANRRYELSMVRRNALASVKPRSS